MVLTIQILHSVPLILPLLIVVVILTASTGDTDAAIRTGFCTDSITVISITRTVAWLWPIRNWETVNFPCTCHRPGMHLPLMSQ